MTVKLIAAHDQSMGIGFDNDLLWEFGTQKADMKRFRELTKGHAVIMGRKTYESIPDNYRPLAGRLNIVLSRDETYCSVENSMLNAGAYYFTSLEAALEFCEGLGKKGKDVPLANRIARQAYDMSSVWLIGGASIYKEALQKGLVDEMFLTEIRTRFNDVDAVLFQNNDFFMKSMERFPADDSNHYPYEFCRMVKDEALIGKRD